MSFLRLRSACGGSGIILSDRLANKKDAGQGGMTATVHRQHLPGKCQACEVFSVKKIDSGGLDG